MGAFHIAYRVVVVQLGLSQAAVGDRTEHVLAAADDNLVRANRERLELWGSP